MAGKTAILAVKIVGDAVSGKQAIEETGGAADGLFGKLKGGAGIALGIGTAVVGAAGVAGKALFSIGETWDDVADTIRVGTGATGDALDGLVDSAKTVASSIPAAVEDIGPVIADVNTRMGLTGDTLETVASQYLEAGRILGETVDINKTSAAFSAFKIEGAAVEGAMDSLFQVSQATGVGMNDLADKVSKAGPALTNLGFGFEDAIAFTGSLDKAGIDASATMASMQKGLVTLARSGEEPADAFKRVVGEVQGFVDTGNTAAALDLASQVFGTRGAAQFVGAIQSGTLATEDLMGATGATSDTILGLGQETADAAEKWQLLKNKALVALEPLGAMIFDGVGAALDWIVNLVDNFDWTPISTGIDAVVGTVGGFESVLAALSDWVVGVFMPTIDGFIESFRVAWEAGVEIVAGFVDGARGHIEPLVPTIQGIFDTIGTIITTVMQLVGEIVTQGTAFIRQAWEIIGPPLTNIVGGIFNAIVGIVRPAVDLIKNIIKTALSIIRGDWSGAWDGIRGIASSAWGLIKGIVSGAIGVVKSTITGALDIISGAWSTGWTGIKTTLGNAWDGIKTAVSTGINAVVDFFRKLPGRVTGALTALPGQMRTVGRNIIEGLIGGIRNMASRAVDSVKGVVNSAIDGAKRLLGIASPSKVFREIGMWTGAGLAEGLTGQTSAVATAGRRLVDAAIPATAPDLPIPTISAGTGHRTTAAGGINITVNGALDPDAVARQILGLITSYLRIRGTIAVNELAL